MHLISALKENQIDNGKNIKIYIFFIIIILMKQLAVVPRSPPFQGWQLFKAI